MQLESKTPARGERCVVTDLAKIDPQTAFPSRFPQGRDHLGDVCRAARLTIAEALVYRGQRGALEAIASASRSLAPWIHEGGLLHCAAFDPLQEVAENLGLVDAFGQDAVQSAMADGVTAYQAEARWAA